MKDDQQRQDDEGVNEMDLAEVIRLQAEALARISGKMAGHRSGGAETRGGTGPRGPARGRSEEGDVLLSLRSGGQGESLPALADDPALSAESMPVLNAFRKFLDAERRRTRARMIQTWVLLACVILGILAVAFVVGRRRLAGIASDVQAQRDFVNQSRTETEVEVRRVNWVVQELQARNAAADADLKRMRDSALQLRQEMTNQVLSVQTQLVLRLEKQTSELLDGMNDKLTSLQIENAMLQNALKDLQTRAAPQPAEGEVAPPAEDAAVPPAPAETALERRPAERTPPASPAPERAGSSLVIDSTNLARAVEFRLPALP